MKNTRIHLTFAIACLIQIASGHALANGAGAHTPIKVYLASGNSGATLVQGNNLVNKTRVSCPRNVTSCTLAMYVMDKICEIGNDQINEYNVIVSVDGVQVDAGAEGTTGYAPCDSRSWVGNFQVGPGPHSVALTTNLGGQTATQSNWSVNYTTTTP